MAMRSVAVAARRLTVARLSESARAATATATRPFSDGKGKVLGEYEIYIQKLEEKLEKQKLKAEKEKAEKEKQAGNKTMGEKLEKLKLMLIAEKEKAEKEKQAGNKKA